MTLDKAIQVDWATLYQTIQLLAQINRSYLIQSLSSRYQAMRKPNRLRFQSMIDMFILREISRAVVA